MGTATRPYEKAGRLAGNDRVRIPMVSTIHTKYGRLIQWLECMPDKHNVDGSIPSSPTSNKCPEGITLSMKQSDGVRFSFTSGDRKIFSSKICCYTWDVRPTVRTEG
jgi:hypothetical protein